MKCHFHPLAVAGIAALVSVGSTASVVPAHALTLLSTRSTAVCSILSPETVTPGVSLSPQTFAYDSGGETAQLTCLGAFKGFAVTGPGRYSEKGTLTGTCVQSVQGSGPGHFSLTVPTSGGSVRVEGDYTAWTLGAVGSEKGTSISSTFEIIPTSGTCVTPIMSVLIVQQSIFQT